MPESCNDLFPSSSRCMIAYAQCHVWMSYRQPLVAIRRTHTVAETCYENMNGVQPDSEYDVVQYSAAE